MSGAPPPRSAAAATAASCSSSTASGRRRPPNSRLGVVAVAPTLPPLDAGGDSSVRQPLARQQAEERAALEEQFTARVRAHRRITGVSRLAQAITAALDDGRAALEPADHAEGEDLDSDDAFSTAGRLIRVIDSQCPHAAQLLSLLVRETRGIVQVKLRRETERPSRFARSTTQAVPECAIVSSSSDEAASSDDSGSDSHPHVVRSPRPPPPSNRRRFRTSLRTRCFPPTRVPDADRVAATSAYTPFRHHHKGAVTNGELHINTEAASSGATDGAVDSPQWTVVLFPRVRPSLSREEIGALAAWADATLERGEGSGQGNENRSSEDPNAVTAAAIRLREQLAARELIAYELSRLVFDKCPTTARFLHGLFVELQELATRTLATADKDARVLDQRHRNALLEHQKLSARRDAVENSLVALQDAMKRRQQQLLTERERTIHQRKKLNVLLAADQVVIRRVLGVMQHAIESADELLAAAKDTSESAAGSPLPAPSLTPTISPCSQPYSAVQDIVELVASKYAALPAVQQVERECRTGNSVQRAARAAYYAGTREVASDTEPRQIVVLDTDTVSVAAEELKAASERLARLLSPKCPDSSVGWAAEDLWDQALFIPSPEDVQDISRDVQRLCAHVEEFVLSERRRRLMRRHDGTQVHQATQTESTMCEPSPLHGRKFANAFLLTRSALPSSSVLTSSISTENHRQGAGELDSDYQLESTPRRSRQHLTGISTPTEHVLGINSNGQVCVSQLTESQPSAARLAMRQESNGELLSKFLPEGLRPFVRSIPVDYEPRQLSLAVVHGVISYVLNEMWELLRQENLLAMSTASAMRRFGTSPRPISVRSAHEYLHRIYLEHFQSPSFAVCRLLDLLVSVSRLDTQSYKVLLFCRLVGLPGTDPLPPDSLWFLLKALHVLQHACVGSGSYFLLDAHGANEFVPQASAWEALSQLFYCAGSDVIKRLRMRLAGLASVYGAVWIPVYSIMEIVAEEWTLSQTALRSALKEAMSALRSADGAAPSFAEFVGVFEGLNLRVSRIEAAQAYRQLLSNVQRSRSNTFGSDHAASGNSGDTAAFDLERFNEQWLSMVLAAVNRAQHQQYQSPQAYAASRRLNDGSAGGGGSGALVRFDAPCEALASANQELSRRFLRATWEQTKPDFIRWLDLVFHDFGIQMRLIQQMDSVCNSEIAADQAWRSLQQLIHIVALDGAPGSRGSR